MSPLERTSQGIGNGTLEGETMTKGSISVIASAILCPPDEYSVSLFYKRIMLNLKVIRVVCASG